MLLAFASWSAIVSVYPLPSPRVLLVAGLLSLFGITAFALYRIRRHRLPQLAMLLTVTMIILIMPIRAAVSVGVPRWGIAVLILAYIVAWVLPIAGVRFSQDLYELYSRIGGHIGSGPRGLTSRGLVIIGAMAAASGMYMIRVGATALVDAIVFLAGSIVAVTFSHFLSHQIRIDALSRNEKGL